MAKKSIIDAITKLYSKLGGNLSDVLGTRSNVNFMGTGKSSEPFLDMDLNIEALGAISKSKALQELKSSVGFATASKHTQHTCLLYTSPSPRDRQKSRMPSSA